MHPVIQGIQAWIREDARDRIQVTRPFIIRTLSVLAQNRCRKWRLRSSMPLSWVTHKNFLRKWFSRSGDTACWSQDFAIFWNICMHYMSFRDIYLMLLYKSLQIVVQSGDIFELKPPLESPDPCFQGGVLIQAPKFSRLRRVRVPPYATPES